MKFVKACKISGALEAPASKSVMQRAVFAASLARGRSLLLHASLCEDSQAAIDVARRLGAQIEFEGSALAVTGAQRALAQELCCAESGLCLRMAAAIAALSENEISLSGKGSLLKRPVQMIEEPLRQLGVECQTNKGYLPIRIKGPLKGGLVQVDGSTSSQFLSGLLMALPLCKEDSRVLVSNLKSKPYIELTLDLLKQFSISIESSAQLDSFNIKGAQTYLPREIEIEGDWSGASCLLVAGATAGEIVISNLRRDSQQADRAILDVLEAAKADLEWQGSERLRVSKAKDRELQAFCFDATHCPDLFPALVALACSCKGLSRIYGASRLLAKESNRLEALVGQFSRIGARISGQGDCIEVEGGSLKGGEVSSYNDHRIAMAAAVAALVSQEGVSIEGEDCVAKSYPKFYEDLNRVSVIK